MNIFKNSGLFPFNVILYWCNNLYRRKIEMVFLIKLLVKIIKLTIALNKFGLLDEVISMLEGVIPSEYADYLV